MGSEMCIRDRYCPWANGTAERANRTLLKTLRGLISERRLNPTDWDYLLPVVEFALNHMPRPILGDRTPLEVMLGRATQMPAELVFFKGPNLADATQVDINSKIVTKYCSKLAKKIDDVNIELTNAKAAADSSTCQVEEQTSPFRDWRLCVYRTP